MGVKIFDFGLFKLSPKDVGHSHVSILVKDSFGKGTLDRIVDPNLKGEIAPECLRMFGEVGDSCFRDNGIDRPGMNDVVWGLEFALQLQEAAEKIAHGDGGLLPAALASPSVPLPHGEATTTDDDEVFTRSVENVSRSTVSNEGL
ncbi:unnamed protein product [Ilex paraguariensis]|uniref:Receptor-like kinase n=1 Tax=Ilex paraguariensis TaxID=185542 RepID=A0ABC8UTU1_9AQUA